MRKILAFFILSLFILSLGSCAAPARQGNAGKTPTPAEPGDTGEPSVPSEPDDAGETPVPVVPDDAPVDPETLKEKFPEYFGLSTAKGLEVYVWETAPASCCFGLLAGTNREKTYEELFNLKSASAAEMRAILSTYDIDESEVIIVLWQNPISNHLPLYCIRFPDETDEDLAKRRQEYADDVCDMLFGPGTTES